MSRCTLLVDGNWLLRSRKFAVEDKFAIGLDDYTPGFIALKQLLSQSLIGMINALKIVDDVIIVRDGGSWRKKLEKPRHIALITKRTGSFQNKMTGHRYGKHTKNGVINAKA